MRYNFLYYKICFIFSSCLCVLVASIFSFLLSGCVSFDSSSKKDEVAQMRSSVSQELINVKQEVNSLKGQIEELDYRLDKIFETQKQQSNEINATLKEWRRETQNDVQKRISDTKTKLQLLEKKQVQDIKGLEEKDKIIVEEITKENKELRRQIDSIRPSVTYAAEEGYYIVAEGDTLSKIAQRFGVSIKTLMETNGITDPNAIRKGQKLAIPK